jgi:hypothetical protein
MHYSTFEEMVDSVSQEHNGRAEILSPFGLKVEIFEGKKYLVAVTKEELVAALETKEARKYSQQEINNLSVCLGGRMGCVKGGCEGSCVKRNANGIWYCYCTT